MSKKLNFETSLLEYGEVNSGFARVKISILTHEQVANGTKFTKECIDRRKSGLNYLPVIGEFKEDDFGTHGGRLECDDDGFRMIDTTRPYGVVIQDSARWENIKMKNGETQEYLVADAYLWIDRYPELNALYDGKPNNQSMEIKVLDGSFNEDTWVYDVNDFEFSALCILGKSITPAFDLAKVDVNFEKQDFKARYEQMVSALNTYLSNKEGGDVVEDNKEFEQEEVVETEVETVEEVEKEVEVGQVDEEQQEETETEVVETEETEVEESTEETENTDESFESDVTNEEPSVDYESLHTELKEKYELLEQEVVALREFKAEKDKQEKLNKINSFSTHLTDDELKGVYASVDTKTVEELETMCFALLGKKKVDGKFSKQENKNTNVKVATIESTYGMKGSWLDILSEEK